MTVEDPKRKFRRRNVHVEVRVRDESGGGEVMFDTHDISAGGLFLRSDLLLELGELLELEIPYKGQMLPAKAKVVRTVRAADLKSGPGMGIEFVNPTQALRDAINELLGSAQG